MVIIYLAFFYVLHLGSVSNTFNDNGQNRILGKLNQELTRHPLNFNIWGEQLSQRGSFGKIHIRCK